MNNIFFALSNLAGVIPSSMIGTSRTTRKAINFIKKEMHMLKNLPALKSSYQTAFELRRQVRENEELMPNAREQLNSRTHAVAAANNAVKNHTGGFESSERIARQCTAKTRLDEAISDQEASAKELTTLFGTLERLRTSLADANVELLGHADEAIFEITRSHKISIEKDQKLRQMILDIYSSRILATHVRNYGVTGFSQQEVTLSFSVDSDWYRLVSEFFGGVFTEPSEDELKAALIAFKEKYGFSSLSK